MVDFVLEDDGFVAAGGDGSLDHVGGVEGFDHDFVVAVGIALVFVVDGKATFAIA